MTQNRGEKLHWGKTYVDFSKCFQSVWILFIMLRVDCACPLDQKPALSWSKPPPFNNKGGTPYLLLPWVVKLNILGRKFSNRESKSSMVWANLSHVRSYPKWEKAGLCHENVFSERFYTQKRIQREIPDQKRLFPIAVDIAWIHRPDPFFKPR